MVKNKQCLSCSTKYSHCPDCSKVDALKPSWASEFCSEECMVIWKTATKHNLGMISKSEAKSIISELSLKPTEQYVKCIQRDLKNIMTEEPKVKLQPKRTKKIEPKLPELVVTPTIIEETTSVIEPVLTEEAALVAEVSHEVIIKKEE